MTPKGTRNLSPRNRAVKSSPRKLIKGVNDLETLFPEIAKQLVNGDPSTITRGSTKKYDWRCSKGHIWTTSVAQRTRNGGNSNCSVCTSKKIEIGFNDLKSKFPEIAKEADGWDPTTVSFGSNKKKPWKCSKGHKWVAFINNRTSHGIGCPYCTGRIPIMGVNDLATTHPLIAAEIINPDPKTVSFGSGQMAKWKCSNGHIWKGRIAYRTGSRKQECPECHIRLKNIIIGKNDLATTHPEIAKQANGWDPTTVSMGSGERKSWICDKKHVWNAVVGKRTSKDPRNCPFCSNQKVLAGFNDLKSKFPSVADLALGWDPSKVISGSNSIKEWKCKKGHIFRASIYRMSNKGVCSVCANIEIVKGVNDLRTTNSKLADEAHGWDPSTIHAGSHLKKEWKCELGHTWSAVVSSRKKNGCPTCGNRKVLIGFNDLASKYPSLAKEAHGWDPTTVAFATTQKMEWKCENHHVWKSTVKNRSQLDRGCPSCATSGFDPNIDGWLYFLEHPVWEMLQIGITNYPDNRLATHKKLGWEVVEIRGPMQGDVARAWETEILRMLKIKGAKFDADKEQGKFTGFSESWIKSSFRCKSLRELMNLVEELESGIEG